MQNLRRTVKNVAYNYSDAQKAVREATSNNAWGGPTTMQMVEIADMMKNPIAFNEIMSIIWKRMNDSGKNWRHVFKSLLLLDFLIKAGNDRVATLCKHNLYAIETLRDFQHVEEGRDQGIHIRDKARQLVAQLGGQTATNGTSTSSAAGSSTDVINSQPVVTKPPSSAAEEAEQLRLAMELSLQEQKRHESQKDDFEVQLQKALEESKREAELAKSNLANKGDFTLNGAPKSNVDDLLSLGDINMSSQPSSSVDWYNMGANDPWTPQPVVEHQQIAMNHYENQKIPGIDVDPWSAQPQPVNYPAYSTYGLDVPPPSGSSVAPHNNLHSYADPFSGTFLGNNYDTPVDYERQNNNNLVAQSSTKDFLGVGNSQVDVDSLITLENFGSSNPFLTPQRKNLTLNEMKAQQQGYPTPPISPYPSSIPASQIPISPNNPFASAF